MKRIGLALGGGGVRGLAHVQAFQVFDGCGIRPAVIAGTSMGAVMGALYAAGIGGAAIREHIEDHIITGSDHFRDILEKAPELFKWLSVVSINMGRGGFLKADGFLKYVFNYIKAETFEELKIPLRVVATDFRTGGEVVFDSGELRPAIRASMAIPGIFAPVRRDGRILVDGGIANNVPYSLLKGRCDMTVAVDVSPARSVRSDDIPSSIDAVLGMYDLLLEKVNAAGNPEGNTDIYVRPGIRDVRVLDFNKIESVFAQAGPAMEALETRLRGLCGPAGAGTRP